VTVAPLIVVVIPAYDESERIAETVTAALSVTPPHTDPARVVVVDDGSSDDTGDRAAAAGAIVARHPRRRGKGAALATGTRAAEELGASHLVFLDADLRASAAQWPRLAAPVLAGAADLSVATLPAQEAPGGGRGRVVRLARAGIASMTGFRAEQPLSGQRCLTIAAYRSVSPLARGFGIEVGMTIDAVRAGLRVVEVPVPFFHRVTGADWRGAAHRARQLVHVARTLVARRARRAGA
jgi:glycosyltransferase involved in cell wall biosynthesis